MIHSILVLFIGAPAPVPALSVLYQSRANCMMRVPDTDDGGMVPHCVSRQHLRRSARKSFCHQATAEAVPAGVL